MTRIADPNTSAASGLSRPSLAGHLAVMRIDHWVKNVFVLPGIVVALMFDPSLATWSLVAPIVVGLLCTCAVASSNYVLNEALDARTDVNHPTKHRRSVPAGSTSKPLLCLQWLALGVGGIAGAFWISHGLVLTLAALWFMGWVYNIPPVRTKDLPYIDVLSEAINNPLRMLIGWFIVGPPGIAPASLLASYWMIGSYFMAIKRYAELRQFADRGRAAQYRKSFAYYTEDRLLVAITFYGSAAMLFLGAFAMRYRVELILAFPAIALVMSIYMALGFKEDSAAHSPEKLLGELGLVTSVAACAVLMGLLLFVDIPILESIFVPTPMKRVEHATTQAEGVAHARVFRRHGAGDRTGDGPRAGADRGRRGPAVGRRGALLGRPQHPVPRLSVAADRLADPPAAA
jgi:4-hydroxybenzoate polyprenyltransferase